MIDKFNDCIEDKQLVFGCKVELDTGEVVRILHRFTDTNKYRILDEENSIYYIDKKRIYRIIEV